MMKRSGLGRKPEGASISHNPYITGLQVAEFCLKDYRDTNNPVLEMT